MGGAGRTRRCAGDRAVAVERRTWPTSRPTARSTSPRNWRSWHPAPTHRVRVDDANYADASGESAVASTTGIRMSGRENGCYVSVSTLADEGDGDDAETQTGFGFSVGRSPDEFDLDRAAREAVDRATRLLGATKPSSRRLTVVLDPFVTAQFLGVDLVDAQR